MTVLDRERLGQGLLTLFEELLLLISELLESLKLIGEAELKLIALSDVLNLKVIRRVRDDVFAVLLGHDRLKVLLAHATLVDLRVLGLTRERDDARQTEEAVRLLRLETAEGLVDLICTTCNEIFALDRLSDLITRVERAEALDVIVRHRLFEVTSIELAHRELCLSRLSVSRRV